MEDSQIDDRALVAPTAEVGSRFEAAAFSIVEPGVRAGADCRLAAGAILRTGVVLGDGVHLDSYAVLGGDPQSLGFDAAIRSGVRVGDGVRIREGATVHRGSAEGAETLIGRACFLMAQSHVGHDCVLGESVVVCNAVLLAGHVTVGDGVFIGGGAGVHQFCRIGEGAMIAGNARISVDVPPYVMAAERNVASGLNLVGLRRGGVPRESIADLKRCYQILQGAGDPVRRANEVRASGCGHTPEGARFLDFFRERGRGFVRSVKEATG